MDGEYKLCNINTYKSSRMTLHYETNKQEVIKVKKYRGEK